MEEEGKRCLGYKGAQRGHISCHVIKFLDDHNKISTKIDTVSLNLMSHDVCGELTSRVQTQFFLGTRSFIRPMIHNDMEPYPIVEYTF